VKTLPTEKMSADEQLGTNALPPGHLYPDDSDDSPTLNALPPGFLYPEEGKKTIPQNLPFLYQLFFFVRRTRVLWC
jgi:hypothetical protein